MNFDPFMMPLSFSVVSFQLDAAGLFQYMVPGVQSSVMGFVSLLAAAQALGQVKSSINPNTSKPIMFTFFQGVSMQHKISTQFFFLNTSGLGGTTISDPVVGGRLLGHFTPP